MEFTDILNFLKDLPFWAWVILLILYAILFGDRKRWEYEVKFPLESGIGRGEIELECLKKKGTQIEAAFNLEPAYHHKQIEVFRNQLSIYTIPPEKNNGKRIFIKHKTPLERPNEGDEITVKIGGQDAFSGRLVLD